VHHESTKWLESWEARKRGGYKAEVFENNLAFKLPSFLSFQLFFGLLNGFFMRNGCPLSRN
jgi:hypothetical protein